ncbi:DUF6319 family protein [Nocardia sp. AG03]|uniref:DUF6319 family protein n=1 Tax=Nocardia sp. AG03 TaxID=3025312 RepID=UPI0024187522|nr:DUF6319 family protein [Nocardia sp. AG03]
MSSPSTKSASRRSAPQILSEAELARIAGELAEGKPPMVWFTAAAVGVAEGKSGKVVALGDPADGDFLQVRPTGSKDVLSFGPSEVTLTKPARGAAAAPSNRKDTTVTQPSTQPSAAPTPPRSLAPVPDAAPTPAAKSTPAAAPAAPAPAARPAKAPAARKAKAPEVTVTLTGTADGEWTVDVVNGKKRSVKGMAVTSAAVAQAAKILHPEVAEVVAGILEAARGAQQQKVEQLQAELEAAKRLLAELGD